MFILCIFCARLKAAPSLFYRPSGVPGCSAPQANSHVLGTFRKRRIKLASRHTSTLNVYTYFIETLRAFQPESTARLALAGKGSVRQKVNGNHNATADMRRDVEDNFCKVAKRLLNKRKRGIARACCGSCRSAAKACCGSCAATRTAC